MVKGPTVRLVPELSLTAALYKYHAHTVINWALPKKLTVPMILVAD